MGLFLLTPARAIFKSDVCLNMQRSKDIFEEFPTKINGLYLDFQAGFEEKSQQFYAQAFLARNGMYCNTAFSDVSIEEAILKLVKILEK